jgi:Raf kinase inhibitor-like YbhB/YbcL family protein
MANGNRRSAAAIAARALAPAAAALALASCGGGNDFTLASNDISSGGTIPSEQVFNGLGCTGANVSPELHWWNPPSGTQSFVVTMYDQDAPTGGGFWHWTVFDLPSSARSLAKGQTGTGVSGGAGTQGYTDFAASGYGGPCPPTGDTPHRYTFTIYALKVASLASTAQLSSKSPASLVSFNAKQNAIASASFTATYGVNPTGQTHSDAPTLSGFTLSSTEVQPNTQIANEQVFTGCGGTNLSPTLTWTAGPTGTKSYTVMVYDPDAPTGGASGVNAGFWHWIIFNIPPATTSITIPKGAGAQDAAVAGGIQGTNDYGFSGYGGPCPPAPDGPHHYVFTVYAVKTATLSPDGVQQLGAGATGDLVGFVTRANALNRATFTATYDR